MKTNIKANEKMHTREGEELVNAGVGNLHATLLNTEAGIRIEIVRFDPAIGTLSNDFRVTDVTDLAMLTAIIADTICHFGLAGDELSGDLGCLGYCVARTLGMELPTPKLIEKANGQ